MPVSLSQIRASLPAYKRASDARIWWVYFVVRPLAFPTAWLFLRLGFTANQVTILSIMFNGVAAYLVSRGEFALLLAGALMFHLALLLDSVDGNMARVMGRLSPLGGFLDSVAADLFYVAFFVPLTLGVVHSSEFGRLFDSGEIYVGLGGSAALSILFYRIFRLRLYLTSPREASAPSSAGSDQESGARGRQIPLLLYNNLFTPGGVLLPGVLLAIALRGLDFFVLIYGVAAPVVVTLAVAYHFRRFVRRVT